MRLRNLVMWPHLADICGRCCRTSCCCCIGLLLIGWLVGWWCMHGWCKWIKQTDGRTDGQTDERSSMPSMGKEGGKQASKMHRKVRHCSRLKLLLYSDLLSEKFSCKIFSVFKISAIIGHSRGGGGTDLERGYGDVRPWRSPFHASPVVRKDPISSKRVSSQDPLLRKFGNFSLYSLNYHPNFSSQAPKFGNFQLTSPLFRGKCQFASPTLRKSGPHTPTWKKIECPPPHSGSLSLIKYTTEYNTPTNNFTESYTAKLLFHQSPTRHSDYTVTGQWHVVTVDNWWQHGDYIVDQLCSHHAASS